MRNTLRKLFGATERKPAAAVPQGQRVYAIGDIHGRADLFAALRDAINDDDARRGPAETTVILLGDLIDRGPDSAQVIAIARQWQARRRVRVLLGNHEEMLLDALESDDVLRQFLRFGGRETALSYPIDPYDYAAADISQTRVLLRAAIPAEDREWLAGAEDMIVIGDYCFVHAGIRPAIALAEQKTSDLRWIREPFLSYRGDHGVIVVHGHTIVERPEAAVNRIGIDTGAYQSGRLTALGLEGTARWIIEAVQGADKAIRVADRRI